MTRETKDRLFAIGFYALMFGAMMLLGAFLTLAAPLLVALWLKADFVGRLFMAGFGLFLLGLFLVLAATPPSRISYPMSPPPPPKPRDQWWHNADI